MAPWHVLLMLYPTSAPSKPVPLGVSLNFYVTAVKTRRSQTVVRARRNVQVSEPCISTVQNDRDGYGDACCFKLVLSEFEPRRYWWASAVSMTQLWLSYLLTFFFFYTQVPLCATDIPSVADRSLQAITYRWLVSKLR
jgi:hypothetical protein